jgi:hypothetical protein
MKIFTLHTGTWDGYHLTGLFSTKEKAEAYVKFFNIKDNPTIEEKELDPLSVESGKTPYLATCTKKAKVKLTKKDIYDHFTTNNVHFSHGYMYYYLLADNDAQAIEMANKMRERFTYSIQNDWHKQSNEGEQIL